MYLSHYRLNTKPFQISTDAKFLWLGEKHKEALAVLKYGILDNRGFLLLTGDVGTGKTTLINALLNSLNKQVIVATVQDPGLDLIDFFNFISRSFNMNKNFKNKGTFLVHLTHFLNTAYTNKKKVLLIIDEAQRLDQTLLEEIRLLSNIERAESKLINIFFVGQNEFNDILLKPENRPLRQRITINYNIDPLNEEETEAYIKHRLKISGAREEIFNEASIREVALYSSGYPRLINIICDHTLITGYANGIKIITPEIVKECADELQIKSLKIDNEAWNIPVKKKVFQTRTENNESEKKDGDDPLKPVIHQKPRQISFGKIALYLAVSILLLLLVGELFNTDKSTNTPNNSDKIKNLMEEKPTGLYKDKKDTSGSDVIKKDQPVQKERRPNQEKRESGLSKPKVSESDFGVNLTKGTDEEINLHSKEKKENKSLKDVINQETVEPLANEDMDIYFIIGSNEIIEESYVSLDQLAEIMRQHSGITVTLKGYTDTSGSLGYNHLLSDFRANTVKSYLVGKGIDPSRISAVGMGPDETVLDGETGPDAKNLSRRVEIKILRSGPKKIDSGPL